MWLARYELKKGTQPLGLRTPAQVQAQTETMTPTASGTGGGHGTGGGRRGSIVRDIFARLSGGSSGGSSGGLSGGSSGGSSGGRRRLSPRSLSVVEYLKSSVKREAKRAERRAAEREGRLGRRLDKDFAGSKDHTTATAGSVVERVVERVNAHTSSESDSIKQQAAAHIADAKQGLAALAQQGAGSLQTTLAALGVVAGVLEPVVRDSARAHRDRGMPRSRR